MAGAEQKIDMKQCTVGSIIGGNAHAESSSVTQSTSSAQGEEARPQEQKKQADTKEKTGEKTREQTAEEEEEDENESKTVCNFIPFAFQIGINLQCYFFCFFTNKYN